MRALLPPGDDDIDVAGTYAADDRPTPAGRPWLLIDMVTTVDGAVEVDGRSAALSSPGDRAVFHALRALADVIVVGAGTARAERYGPPRLPDEVVAARRGDGRPGQPELVVVSNRLGFPDDQPFLTADAPVVIATAADAPTDRRAALEDRGAEVVEVGDHGVDPARLVAALAERGHQVALCEGGPTLNGTLLARDLVDELCTTVAPLAAGGTAGRIVSGAAPDGPRRFVLDRVLTEDGSLFLRHVRLRDAG